MHLLLAAALLLPTLAIATEENPCGDQLVKILGTLRTQAELAQVIQDGVTLSVEGNHMSLKVPLSLDRADGHALVHLSLDASPFGKLKQDYKSIASNHTALLDKGIAFRFQDPEKVLQNLILNEARKNLPAKLESLSCSQALCSFLEDIDVKNSIFSNDRNVFFNPMIESLLKQGITFNGKKMPVEVFLLNTNSIKEVIKNAKKTDLIIKNHVLKSIQKNMPPEQIKAYAGLGDKEKKQLLNILKQLSTDPKQLFLFTAGGTAILLGGLPDGAIGAISD